MLLLAVAGLTALLPATSHAQDEVAAEATGLVRITCPVRGAQVYVDNELAGEVPVVRYLPAGQHAVRVAADNYDPFVRRVDVVSGTTVEVDAQLIAGTGTVEFLIQPSGAVLFLNGKEEGKTPARLRGLAEGEYKYRLEAPGYEAESGTFAFKRGKNLLIARSLKSTAGLVEVITKPEGARIYLDGKPVGVSPMSIADVEPGRHVLRLEHPDYALALRTVDNTDGARVTVETRLPSEGTRLSVVTGDPTATVSLDGELIGSGDLVRVNALERGRYRLRVEAAGQQAAETNIEVESSGSLTMHAKLQPASASGNSKITEARPLTRRPVFWAGVGAGTAGVGVATWAIASNVGGETTESPDLIVELP